MKSDFKNISNGKAKDLILESIIRKENKLKQSKEFQNELFINATLEDVNFLLKSIVDSELELIKVSFGNQVYITSIGHISPFLKNGGFEKIETEEKNKKSKESIDFEKSKIDLELAEKMLKEYPYTKWFARISFFIAIILAILEIIQWKNK